VALESDVYRFGAVWEPRGRVVRADDGSRHAQWPTFARVAWKR